MKNFIYAILFIFSLNVNADCEDPQGGGYDTLSSSVELNSEMNEDKDGKMHNGSDYELNGCGEDPIELPLIVASYSNPGPSYYWMGSGTWFLNLHPGSGGGTSSSNVADAKLDYCEMKDNVMALISAMPVSGTVSTGYSIAVSSASLAQSTYDYALQDIERYIQVGLHVHPPALTIINWYDVSIDWSQYDIWTNNQTLNPGNELPEAENGGALQVFAHFLQQLGQGNGTVNQDVLDDMIGEDPQPSVPC